LCPGLLALILLLPFSGAFAKEYGHYDPQRMLVTAETAAGKKHSLDAAYLDQMLSDLAGHARNYPARFDTPQDRQRAVQDVQVLSGMLDILINVPHPNPELLVRAGFLNSLGHNLDIAGSADKANAIFQRLLAAVPAHPRGNYLYGTFLAGTGKPKEALPYLDKALGAGVGEAAYAIGMSYLALGDKAKALESLSDYKRHNPGDARVDPLMDAIRSGKLDLKQTSH
jgi:predicted Zn-dependent protease